MTREMLLNRIWQKKCYLTEFDKGNVTINRTWQGKCYLTEYDKRNVT